MIVRDPISLLQQGYALHQKGELREAEACYREVLDYLPMEPETCRLLGLCLGMQGRPSEGLQYLQSSVLLAPTAPALANLAATYGALCEYDNAEEAANRALGYDITEPTALFTRGLARLAKQDWENGWKDYESGLACGLRPLRRSIKPRWKGERLQPDQTLLIWWEQGYGDTILFSRFVKVAKERAGCRVVLEVQPSLKPLLRGVEGADKVTGSLLKEMPVQHDFQVPLMSLPLVLGLYEPHQWPKEPYISVDTRDMPEFAPTIGYCWRSSAENTAISYRSIPDSQMSFQIPEGWDVVSLVPEKGAEPPWEVTATAIAACKAVVSVDTAVAHLAGAMGKKTYLLLPYHADWRWQHAPSWSPWYPSMEIFRQKIPGAWEGVLRDLSHYLITGEQYT